MKLLIQTQYKENYGAHDWDGRGECPQYWKFKGGDTYVVPGVSNKDLLPALEAMIESSDEAQEEYIIFAEVVADDATECESWETPWTIHVEELGFYASRYVKAEDYWQPGYAGKAESYKMMAGGTRSGYQEAYIKLEKEVA